jgi:hypothetical protein
MLAAERERREQEVSLLESTEGWSKLTERQQRIIQQSLYAQARAERGTDQASASAVESPKTHVTDKVRIIDEVDLERYYADDFGPNPDTRKYKASQNHIVNWFCHAAIANLESEAGLDVEAPQPHPEEFSKAEYKEIKSFEELASYAEEFGFPAVLHVRNSESSYGLMHSSLVLGHNPEGQIFAWEKEGYRLPYRLISLKDLWQEFKGAKLWGLRKLRTTGTNTA